MNDVRRVQHSVADGHRPGARGEPMPDADFPTWTSPAEIAELMRWLAGDAPSTVSGGLVPVR